MPCNHITWILPRLGIIKHYRPNIRSNHNRLYLFYILQRTYTDIFSYKNRPYNLEWLFSLFSDFYLIIYAATDKYVSIGIVVGWDQMGDFAIVLCEVFHFCTVYGVMQGDVSLIVTDDDSLLKEVEVKCAYLIWSDIHIYFLHITI